jgi:hypothetical protein
MTMIMDYLRSAAAHPDGHAVMQDRELRDEAIAAGLVVPVGYGVVAITDKGREALGSEDHDMTPAVSEEMVERALAAWHQAIIAAPETEEVDARRRRCMRAALSAALEVVDAAIKRLWPNGLGPKNLDELVVFVEEERKCDAEYLANAVKIVQSERATPAPSAVANALVERIRVYCEYLRTGTKFDGAVRLMNDVSDFIEWSKGELREGMVDRAYARACKMSPNTTVHNRSAISELIDAALAGRTAG